VKNRKSGKRWLLTIAMFFAAVLLLPHLLFPSIKPMPPGTEIEGTLIPTSPEDIRLLVDDTAWDPDARQRVIRQEIFDELLAMIGRADRFICLDMFLWNPWKGSVHEEHRKLSAELAQALIQQKKMVPDLDIIVLTDPINRIYGDTKPAFFDDLSRARIPVLFTDLTLLSESNRVFAPYWSLAEKVLKLPLIERWNTAPRLKNPFQKGGPDISLQQFGRLLRFKANHRKVAVTGSSRHGLEMLIGSLNPADGSSAHSNMALHIRGPAALEALDSEMEILRWSLRSEDKKRPGETDPLEFSARSIRKKAEALGTGVTDKPEWPKVQLLTEGAIGRTIVNLMETAGRGDEVRIAMFYLSERDVVAAIKQAAKRGASLRLILDANRDAFGMKKIGIPNRPVASELMGLSGNHDIQVRWANTHGEQFHTKSLSLRRGHSDNGVLVMGSANWTRRNIGNLNLEANLLVDNASQTLETFNRYFDTLWENADGLTHTLPYHHWEEKGLEGILKKWVYHLQERWGAGTF